MKERHFSTSVALLNMMESTEEISLGEQTDLNAMIEDYMNYKKSFVRNIKYDPNSYNYDNLGKYNLSLPNEFAALKVYYSNDNLCSQLLAPLSIQLWKWLRSTLVLQPTTR